MQTSRTNALLTATAVSVLALSQWSLSGDSVSAAGAPGTIVLAQAQPKCGQDPQHPCPKGPQPQPKQVTPPQPQPKQAQPTPPPQPKQPTPPPQPKQAQPTPPPQPKQVQPTPPPQPKQVQPATPPQPLPKQVQPATPPKPLPKQVQPATPPQPLPKQVQPATPPQPLPKQVQPATPPQPLPKQVQPATPPQPLPKQVQPATPPQPLPKQAQPVPNQPGTPGAPPAVTFQRRAPTPGPQGQQPGPGGVAPPPPAPVVVSVQQLREQRHERTLPGGRIVIEEPDHRFIERDRGQVFIHHDETQRLLRFEEGRVERRRDGVYTVFVRPDGDQIITITDDDGRMIRRIRRDRFGHEFILLENRPPVAGVFLSLAPPVIRIPREQYIVEMAVAPEPVIYETLVAPPVVPIERPYTLDEIRFNAALRDRMRRIDVDTITFDTGSWAVGPDQVNRLQFIAQAIRDVIARNPNETFLIEGHTDAVGSDEDNLSLSDRRAESVADILTETFQIPPENLTTQGYGAHFLKVQTPEANRQNRRVTVRRITPLLTGSNG